MRRRILKYKLTLQYLMNHVNHYMYMYVLQIHKYRQRLTKQGLISVSLFYNLILQDKNTLNIESKMCKDKLIINCKCTPMCQF